MASGARVCVSACHWQGPHRPCGSLLLCFSGCRRRAGAWLAGSGWEAACTLGCRCRTLREGPEWEWGVGVGPGRCRTAWESDGPRPCLRWIDLAPALGGP